MISSGDFDVATFVLLAKDEPDEFNRRRRQLIDANISAAPAHIQQKLRHLQCRADLVREGARSPLEATQKLSSMMWDSVGAPGGLRGALNALATGDVSLLAAEPVGTEKAKVLQFPSAKPVDSD